MRYLKALLATTVLLGLTGGVPIGLLLGYGNPTNGLTQGLVTDTTILDILVCLAWLIWLQMTLCFAIETLNQTRAHHSSATLFPLPAIGIQADLVRFIIGAILAVGVVSAPLTVTGKAEASTSPAAVPAAAAPASTAPATRAATADLEVIVEPGDSLWELAERHLGDGTQWRAIADLNRGRDVGGGVIATTANLQSGLQPGWHLLIPAPNRSEHHVVEPGEDLSEIALETTGSARNWPSIYGDNQAVIGANPNLIRPGEDLTIPHGITAPRIEEAAPGGDRRADRVHQPSRQRTAIDPPMSSEPTSRPSPSTEGEHTSAPSSEEERAHAHSASDMKAAAPWLITSLLTSGGVLTAFLYLRLGERRRDRFRARRPGYTIAVPDLELAPLEKTITVVGAPNAAAVSALDLELRRLGQHQTQTGKHMPPLAAVELTDTSAVLHLVEPTTLPAPWEPRDLDQLRWQTTLALEDCDHFGGADEDAQTLAAPYPLLATVGSDDGGHWWLLNLEHLGVVTLEGDQDVRENLVRYLAAELAVANWARDARIDLIGIASELEGIDPRVHIHNAAQTSRPAAAAVGRAEEMIQRCATAALDATTARALIPDDEIWPAHLLIVNTIDDATTELADLIQANPTRTATALLATSQSGEPADQAGLRLLVSGTGSLHIAGVGLTLRATQLPASDATAITRLYQQATDLISTSLPTTDGTSAESAPYADASGNLRPEHTIPRGTPTIAVQTTTLLEASDDAYLEAAACVEADLEALAPHVPASASTVITQSDPDLDEDLAEWINHTDRRPHLRLLGQVKAFAYGEHATTVGERISFYTELLAFLWTYAKQGATMEEILSAFPTQSAARVRIDIKRLREWLGTNPQTGQPILPAATQAPARAYRGRNVYQVDCGPGGLLVDVDLLRRLRLAGQAAGGASGVSRIATALVELVDGQPFSRLREGGWSWLLEGDRIDEHMVVAICDMAHIATTHYLQQGDLANARTSADIGILAAPFEETMRLDVVAVTEAEGDRAHAALLLNTSILNRTDDDEGPRDLSERTRSVIKNRRWSAAG